MPCPLRPLRLVAAGLFSAAVASTSFPVAAETAFVIDKLLVGVYEAPDPGSTRLGLYPTATPMERSGETDGEFAKVMTPDGVEGWIRRIYLSAEAPASVVLKEKLAELDALRTRLAALEARADGGTPAEPGSGDGAGDENGSGFDRLVSENTALKARVASLRLELMEARTREGEREADALSGTERAELERLRLETRGLEARLARASDTMPLWRRLLTPPMLPWTLLALGVCFGAGGLGGIYLTDYLHRRRHGGFRI